MTMTQTAVEYSGPSWDETIVPALRKRLQTESRVLSKRMSTVSVTSSQDGSGLDHYDSHSASQHQSSATSIRYQQQLQEQPLPRSSSDRAKPTRSRTFSQPPAFNNPPAIKRPAVNGSAPPIKPTRIPIPASSSSRSPSIPQNGHMKDMEYLSSSPPNDSGSSIRVPSRQPSGILHEPAPFDSASSHGQYEDGYHDANKTYPLYDGAIPRMSTDSEERPFEHWYRGESSRNGGVGEIRIGNRQEMLDIANYGHELRARKRAMAAARRDQGHDIHDTALSEAIRRKRADSVVGLEGQRDSLYIEGADDIAVDDDEEESSHMIYREGHSTYSNGHRTSNSRSVTPTPSLIPRPSSRQQHSIPTKIPRTRRNSNAPSMQRGMSEPPLSMGRRGPSPPSPETPQKRPRTKSPGPASATSSPAYADPKKMGATAANRAKKEKERKQREWENKKSVAHYPVDGLEDDMVNAIPTWTEPIKRGQGGNWDDVVLPAVAKKKGLDGYEVADGSPKQRQEAERYEPAPGTFGYDHSKYRPPRSQLGPDGEEQIPMDEFGRQLAPTDEEPQARSEGRKSYYHDPSQEIPLSTAAGNTARRQVNPPQSPAPFSHYQVSSMKEANFQELQGNTSSKIPEEEDAGGCCKCIIM